MNKKKRREVLEMVDKELKIKNVDRIVLNGLHPSRENVMIESYERDYTSMGFLGWEMSENTEIPEDIALSNIRNSVRYGFISLAELGSLVDELRAAQNIMISNNRIKENK